MAESIQKRLERVRAPRVQISYEVETGGAIEMKELPFVMGVLADLSGHPQEGQPRLKDRKFVEVTPDNFDEVLSSMKPHLDIQVENKLSDDPEAGNINVSLDFKSLDDFAPDRVAQQVGPIKKLLELRQQLADLRGSLQGNEKLDEILQETISDEEALNRLRDELGSEEGDDSDG
jgi:type VI secretion system protein ImpB